MPLVTEVGLGPGGTVSDEDPAPPPRQWAQQPPHFSAHFALARSPISATAELLLKVVRQVKWSGDGTCQLSSIASLSH